MYKRCIYKLAYDGATYDGFQKQEERKTIEGQILEAIYRLRKYDPNIRYVGYASRTDKKVSAVENVIALDITKKLTPAMINSTLPSKNISLWSSAYVENQFKPRFVENKKYLYIYGELEDKERESRTYKELQERAECFRGKNDFFWFAKRDKRNTIRTIDDIKVSPTEEGYTLEVIGKSFIWQQVRKIAAVVFDRTDISITKIRDYLECPKKYKDPQIKPANPRGLVLLEINYAKKIDWETEIYTKRRLYKELKRRREALSKSLAVVRTISDHITDSGI